MYGRPKHIYSIHRKMERKQLSFDQMFDLRAVRIVTGRLEDCYAVLGLVHGRYPYIPGEFDDYIATPKDNFYRSIHTAVFGPEGKPVEVQIRTHEMHDQAELGLAAHWRYKESRAHDVTYDRKIRVQTVEPAQGDETFSTKCAPSSEDRVYALTPRARSSACPSARHSISPIVHADPQHRCAAPASMGASCRSLDARDGEINRDVTHKYRSPAVMAVQTQASS